MEAIRLTDINDPLFSPVWEIYQQSFPLSEQRTLEHQQTALRSPDFYFVVYREGRNPHRIYRLLGNRRLSVYRTLCDQSRFARRRIRQPYFAIAHPTHSTHPYPGDRRYHRRCFDAPTPFLPTVRIRHESLPPPTTPLSRRERTSGCPFAYSDLSARDRCLHLRTLLPDLHAIVMKRD